MRRFVPLIGLAILALVSTAASIQAAEPTQRPLKLVVGFGGGGPTDIVARALAEQLSKLLARPVIVENKPGAAGNIATQTVAAATPDGSTVLIGASPLAINQSLYPELPVKFGRDIVAIAPIGTTENVLVVHPSLGVRNLEGFIQLGRDRPNAITYAALGIGSSSHLAGVAFDMRTGTKLAPVMYRSGGDALKDLLGGHVQSWFATIPSVLDNIQAGQLIALASTGPQRTPWLPQIPTVSESGFPDFDMRLWLGLFAPVGLDPDYAQALENAVNAAISTDDVRRSLDRQGIVPLLMPRSEFNAFVSTEIERGKAIVDRLSR